MGTSESWWRRLRRGRELEAGLDEEIRFHIDRQTEKNERLGLRPAEARRAALLKFGGVERMREGARDEIRFVVLGDLWRDFRYGARTLVRSPGFALVSILTLGLGIGAATAVFTVTNGVLLRPLPYPESERIVRLFQMNRANDGGAPIRTSVSDPNFKDWQSAARSYAGMAEFATQGQVSVVGGAEPARASFALVSREFFEVMRVRPAFGRAFLPEEQAVGARPTVIVSHDYWQQYLNGTTDLAGATLTFNKQVFQVIGVMPRGFDYPTGVQIWAPRELEDVSTSRTAHNFGVIARLADGVTLERATAELSAISRALKQRYGEATWMVDADVVPLRRQLTDRVRPALLILLGAAGLLLLISCANVSNLLLARGAARTRELAVRLALGAGRWRVARQLLAESLVLCGAGGALGGLLSYWGVKALLRAEPGNLPRLAEVQFNGVVLGFAVAGSILTALVLGLATVFRARNQDVRSTLSDAQRTSAGARRTQRMRDGLVVAQVALTLILLVTATLLGRSFLRLLAIDPGFRTDNTLILDLAFDPVGDPAEATSLAQFQESLLARLRRLPGVREVGGVNDFPLGGSSYSDGQFLEMTRPDEIQSYDDVMRLTDLKERAGYAGYRVASAGYFRAMNIPLVRGRLFEPGDGPDAPHVAVISQSLAAAKWPDQDPIGRFVQFGNMDGDPRGFRIIGVVGDVREESPEAVPVPLFYGNHVQRTRAAANFSVVLQGSLPASTAVEAQRVVRQMNPRLPVRVRTVEEALEQALAGRRFSLLLGLVFGISALVLATMGIYGVVSYLVAQRQRELGIRLALGASRRSMLHLVVGKGMRLALFGTVIGIAASLVLTRWVSSLLYGVSPTDPIAFAVVVVTVVGCVLVATSLPALRAARIAPSISLRTE